MRVALLAAALFAQPAFAQSAKEEPAAEFPAGVGVHKAGDRTVYADARGRALYSVDLRGAAGRGGAARLICTDSCTKRWAPLTAPADARPVGEWSVTTRGTVGPQWAYRGSPVFIHLADKPGKIRGDGAEQLWWAIDYVPPAPRLSAPAAVVPLFLGKAYALADSGGHPLYTGTCRADCAGWTPFAAGMAAQGVGDWTVIQSGDRAQWAYRGKPVFVSAEARSAELPAGATLLHP